MTEKISRRKMLKGGIAGAAAGAALTFPGIAKAKSSRKKIKWRMQTHWPTGVGYYQDVYVRFCENVKAATDGDLDITPLPSGAVVPSKDVFQAVGRGMLDCAMIWPAYWIGQVPVAGHINGQLYSWESAAEMYGYFYDMGAIEVFREAYAERGVNFVAPVPCTGIALYSKKPIRKIDDFKGFKVRSTGIAAQVFEKAGATPVFFPGEELYQALQTGVCDGAHWGTVSTAWDMKFQEVTDYIVMPYLAEINNGEVMVSQKKWNELPDDMKVIVEQCARTAGLDFLRWSGYYDLVYIDEFQKKKMGKLSHMDEDSVAQMRKYSIEVVDEYSKRDPKYSKKAGDMLKDLLKMAGRI